jgi:branched-chain amino acid transport system ATP-binding protein
MRLLDVQGLSRSFGGVQAVKNVSFHVNEGEIVALIGPNGAGKSTVLNMVSGVIKPSSGKIFYRNQSLEKVAGYEYANLGITRTFQNLQTFDDMTVLENVMTGLHCRTKSGVFSCGLKLPGARKEEEKMKKEAMKWLEIVGIDHLALRKGGSLAYGQLRLMEIARAMCSSPGILLLDEPAAGLNHTETAMMTKTFRKFREMGTSLLLVEHDMDMIMNLADRIVVLDQGAKIAEGTPQEIQENDRVIAAYLGQEEDTA